MCHDTLLAMDHFLVKRVAVGSGYLYNHCLFHGITGDKTRDSSAIIHGFTFRISQALIQTV
jgi:hypothetical protein